MQNFIFPSLDEFLKSLNLPKNPSKELQKGFEGLASIFGPVLKDAPIESDSTITLKNHKPDDVQWTADLEVPGISPTDLEVTLNPGQRTVFVHRLISESEGKKKKTLLIEFDIPVLYDLETFSAIYKNGILMFHVDADPKFTPKRISIEVLHPVKDDFKNYTAPPSASW